MKHSIALVLCYLIALPLWSQQRPNEDSLFIRNNYQKYEYQIPMRDGTKLFTAVYVPKDASKDKKYPFLMQRTCYSVAPYGVERYPNRLGPNKFLMREKYIFVYQDVRGRWMSEGTWTNMTPHIPNKSKKNKSQVDESSDTFDTIEWLLKNVAYNNGRVGQWGISYPGFYTIASAVEAHPALKASSPQAPIADFFFDDFHHNGAYMLSYFIATTVFGYAPPQPTDKAWYNDKYVRPNTPDGYQFFLDLGSLKNASKYYKEDNFFWQELSNHPNYDEFWQKRSILPHLKNFKHAVMTVGGWFDAEDLYGPLNIYKTLERNNPNMYNTLVMGPFGHGDWARETGHHRHNHIYFGDSISTFYQREIESTFFRHFLKEKGDGKTGLPEAYLFDTGKKVWRSFDKYPSAQAQKVQLYLHEDGSLRPDQAPTQAESFSEYISDPKKPVPYTENLRSMLNFTPRAYMSEDQRFAGRRPDVLVFQTEVLQEDITLGGEILAKLLVSTTGTDADWIVKLIDVYPPNEPNSPHTPEGVFLGGYQQMVRSEVMRGRFRNSFEKPEPFVPNQPTEVTFRLQDVLHTFKKGHRIMIQIQSTWFPLIDRNPQKFVDNIFKAEDSDFIKATHRIYHDARRPSAIEVEVLKD